MSQAAKKNEETLTADVCGKTLSFRIGRADYNKYINSVTQKDKVAPSHNFLMQTVTPESAADLKKILEENPGADVQLASAVLEEYTPDLGIVVKKSSSAQSE
jgi:hypothetical protein